MNLPSFLDWISGLFVGIALSTALPVSAQSGAPATGAPVLRIVGQVDIPQSLTLQAFRALPYETLDARDPHSRKAEIYQGVPLVVLLAKAGAPLAQKLRGEKMPWVVLAESWDGYRVAFALAELDTRGADAQVLVADTVNGAPLDAARGPWRLIVTHDKRPAWWVHGLTRLRLVLPAKVVEKP